MWSQVRFLVVALSWAVFLPTFALSVHGDERVVWEVRLVFDLARMLAP